MKIAIDGPAGAGKSTVARRIAAELGVLYIDTGAMYRVLTWKAMQMGIDFGDSVTLRVLARDTVIEFQDDVQGPRVYCDGREVSSEIRSPDVSKFVSVLAADDGVRQLLVKTQQDIAQRRDVVMDGRDITHVVLPDAEFKFFLTASIEERTHRRSIELESQGYSVDMLQLRKEIQERDRRDRERSTGALMITSGTIVIDTTNMNFEEVVSQILSLVREG
ncbi:MAG: (d)CMP kinase [Syntrophomonadaceae bacterium]|nr:(d)CMP kinase [Syntrophomonadaceae bacterium]